MKFLHYSYLKIMFSLLIYNKKDRYTEIIR